MATTLRFVSHGLTHVGLVRQSNEDGFLERPEHGIWAVADGMGGHEQGDYASACVVNRLAAFKPFASGEPVDDAGTGIVALLVAAHAVGHGPDAVLRPLEKPVLVALAHQPDMRQAVRDEA